MKFTEYYFIEKKAGSIGTYQSNVRQGISKTVDYYVDPTPQELAFVLNTSKKELDTNAVRGGISKDGHFYIWRYDILTRKVNRDKNLNLIAEFEFIKSGTTGDVVIRLLDPILKPSEVDDEMLAMFDAKVEKINDIAPGTISKYTITDYTNRDEIERKL
jgi:hypothetical protein